MYTQPTIQGLGQLLIVCYPCNGGAVPDVLAQVEKAKRSAMKSLQQFEKNKSVVLDGLQKMLSGVEDIAEKNFMLRMARAPSH